LNDILPPPPPPPPLQITNPSNLSQYKPHAAKNAEARQKYTSPPSPPLQLLDKLQYHPCRQGEGDKKQRSEHPIHYEDLGPDMEQVRPDVKLAWLPINAWSKFIQLGLPASNLFLIHHFLSIECTMMLDIPVRWLINVKRDIIDGPFRYLEQ
jgi:hypothetical protein